MRRSLKTILTTAAVVASLGTAAFGGSAYSSTGLYIQTNLVSNDNSKIPANHQDTTLVNPWGIAFLPGTPFWINDNGSGISALYNGDGSGAGGADPAPAVIIPVPKGGKSPSAPTG